MQNSNIVKGNLALRAKNYREAIDFYSNAIKDGGVSKRIAEFNLELIKKRTGLEGAVERQEAKKNSLPDYIDVKISDKFYSPKISIIIPVCDDEDYISRALNSCKNQTLHEIEIICVDDNSSDATLGKILDHANNDYRIRVYKFSENMSALQARRLGIRLSKAPYIIFLDGDDELHRETAARCYKEITETKADVVGFGVTVAGRSGSNFEKSLFPVFDELNGTEVIQKIFPIGKPAQGHIWRYCFSRDLLLCAYEQIPSHFKLFRANDLPISFLAIALAEKYVSIKNNFYIYNMNNGGSGHLNIDYEKFIFYCGGLSALNIIEAGLSHYKDNNLLGGERYLIALEAFKSVKLSVIGNIIRYLIESLNPIFREKAIEYLISKVSHEDLLLSLACFRESDFHIFKKHISISKKPKVNKIRRSVLLVANNLDTGGLQGVVIMQARHLLSSGHSVKILVYSGNNNVKHAIPQGVEVIFLNKIRSDGNSVEGNNFRRICAFLEILKRNNIDTLIDHGILYRDNWLYYALLAQTHGVRVIGWLHSFALRTVHSRYKHVHFLNKNISLLDSVVTLSETDVTYWKLLGCKSVYYLPNPPSPLLTDHTNVEKACLPNLENPQQTRLLWYGRLQENAKRVSRLIDVARELRRLTSNFRLDIVGPESHDLKISDLNSRIKKAGLENNVFLHGERRGAELVKFLRSSNIFVFVSDIEGYPLVISEAQSFGLPVVMYELPWLAALKNNKGVHQVVQDDATAMAVAIYEIAKDRRRYSEMSKASIEASSKYLSFDFKLLYNQLLNDDLPSEFRPEINVESAGLLFELNGIYTELHARE